MAIRLAHRVQLTTDGLKAYLEAIEEAFGAAIDYAQLIKLYGPDPQAEKRYSPAQCIGTGNYVLNVDATIIESEKEAAQWTYQKVKGYQPLLGFVHREQEGSAEAKDGTRLPGLIVADEFKDGNVPAGAKAVDFLKRCTVMLPVGKKLSRLRTDSAWYQAEVVNYCREEKCSFTICADLDVAVRAAIHAIKEWRPYRGDRKISKTVHTMRDTKEAKNT